MITTPPAAASTSSSSNGSPNLKSYDGPTDPAELAQFKINLDATYARLQNGLKTRERDYEWRMFQLHQLKTLIEENEDQIFAALWKDLRKNKFECQSTEHGVVISEIDDAMKNLRKWMRKERVSTSLYNWPGKSFIHREPYGLTLIIGAWNYPFQLTLAPLVGAIAGGNACLMKPPNMTPETSALIARLIPNYLDKELFAVVEGGKDEVTEVLKKKFDLIFFTGGTLVGQVVLTAAVANLTPVVLELGGKSPAIVMDDADVKVTARRITWGKFMNAGQTCIAPDYVIAQPAIKHQLVEEIRKSLKEFYGDDPQKSPDYCRIVNGHAFDRLATLTTGTDVVIGGKTDRNDLYIEPTVVLSKFDTEIMKNEVFGPILPVIEIEDPAAIMDFINSRPKPLALYLFTHENSVKKEFLNGTTSGGFVVNDVVMHMPQPSLPFGGVGASGMGHYHGKYSFETFTHARGVLQKSFAFDVPVRYAPYTDTKAKFLRWLFS